MKKNSGTNIFTHFKQEENQFTNGLISILELSKVEDDSFVFDFFQNTLELTISRSDLNFKVLREIEGTADGEISNHNVVLLIETKIISGALRREQIESHIEKLNKKKQIIKRLILLTPDNSKSQYIKQFTELDSNIVHLEWKKVYNFLDSYISKNSSLLSKIISQYLSTICDTIFEQDIVAVIVKIDFGDKSGVHPDTYLIDMENGKWNDWRTPRKYKHLDSQGRKLILYDRTQKALTVEVEIKEVKETNKELGYPWSNEFIPETVKIYRKPIPVEKIRNIKGFENFGVYRKDRSAYRNVTHEQYEALIESSE